MTNDQLFTLLMVAAAVIVLIALYLMSRHEHEARLGRMLLDAAGSEHAERMAIESANLDRLLSQKYEGELDRAKRHHGTRLPSNVVRLAPRILNRGRTVNFTPDGDAA